MSTQAVLFIVGFLVVLFAYIGIMIYVVRRLNYSIARDRYSRIERIIIGGIALGAIAMFQPWVFSAYKYGFLLVLFSTLTFIIWNHVTPRGVRREGDLHGVSITEIEGGPDGSR